MLHVKFGLCSRSWTLLILLLAISSMLLAPVVHATPPMEEIRAIISQRALRAPPPELLAALDSENLGESLRAIDPYAHYLPPAIISDNFSPSLYLGIEIFDYKSRRWIRSYPGGPAARAGIPEIGILQAINNKSVKNNDIDKISQVLDKAMREDRVTLTVSSLLNSRAKTYKVKPIASQPSSITWDRIGSNVVVRIRNFTAHDTAPRLLALCEALVRTETRIVIDLRGCSGGDLYESIEIAGLFVAAGRLLASTYDRKGLVQTYRSPPGRKLVNPIWLLIDQRTASAAEIMAGILQYHKLAHVVGDRSYGKFVSQTIFPLSEGGELWLTTLAVRLPDNLDRSGKGIKPDILYHDISVAKFVDIIGNLSNDFVVPN